MADEARLKLHPDVNTKTMKRGPLYILVVIGACLFLYLADSMGLLEDATKPKPGSGAGRRCTGKTDAADSGSGSSIRDSRQKGRKVL